MSPARCQYDVARRGQPLEASVAVDLQHTTEVLEMSGRTLCLAIRTVEVDCGRRFRPGPGSIIARIDPQPAGLGAASVRDRAPGSACRRQTAWLIQTHALRGGPAAAPATNKRPPPSLQESSDRYRPRAGRRFGSACKAGGDRSIWRPGHGSGPESRLAWRSCPTE